MIPTLRGLLLIGILGWAHAGEPAAAAQATAAPTAAEVAQARRELVQVVVARDDARERIEAMQVVIALHPGKIKALEVADTKAEAAVEKAEKARTDAFAKLQEIEGRQARHEKEQLQRRKDMEAAGTVYAEKQVAEREAKRDVNEIMLKLQNAQNELKQAQSGIEAVRTSLATLRARARELVALLPKEDPAAVQALADDRDPAKPPSQPKEKPKDPPNEKSKEPAKDKPKPKPKPKAKDKPKEKPKDAKDT